jgi:hypothetical protein
VVQGVALELLCRLLFTEGSNPSLSVPSPNSRTLLTAMDQITMNTIIPTGRPFFDIDSLFLIAVVRKILERVADPFMIHEWEKIPIKPLSLGRFTSAKRGVKIQNYLNPCCFS